MFVMYDLITIFDKFGMVPKALLPIVATDSGITIEVKPQPLNAFLPMVVIEAGNVIEVKLLHPLNAFLPMVVIELPRITVFKFVLLEKAESGTFPK